MLTRLFQMVSIVLTGLLAGLFAGRWLGAPASRQYDGPVFTEVQQRIDTTVGARAPGLIMAAIVALAVTLLLVRRPAGARLLLTAGALILVVALTVSTQIVNVPINEEINSWVIASPPADWTAVRDRWEAYHTLRTVFAVVALIMIAASVTLARDPLPARRPVGAAAS